MMQFAVCGVIVATMLIEYLAESFIIPKVLAFTPELMGGLVLLYVLLEGRKTRFARIRGAYWLVFGAILIHVIGSVIVNQVEPGVIISGLRYLLRGLPLFFLPLIMDFTERQYRIQVGLIIALALVQAPMALYQILFTDATGDGISGTLLQSGWLSCFQVALVGMLAAAKIRGKVGWPTCLFLGAVLLLPAAINETKITFFILPLTVLTVIAAGARRGKKWRSLAVATVVSAAALTVLFVVYDGLQKSFEARDTGESTVDLAKFFSEGQYLDYLESSAELGDAPDEEDGTYVGRINAIAVPFEYVSRDPVTLWFGMGTGNASRSPLGDAFEGHYGLLFDAFVYYTAVRVLLELGVGGLLLTLLFMTLVLRDSTMAARRTAEETSWRSAFALGWMGVSVLMYVLVFYIDTVISSAFAFLYWYGAGIAASLRMKTEPVTPVQPARPPPVGRSARHPVSARLRSA